MSDETRPRCLACSKLLRATPPHRRRGSGADGRPARWGDYGDNVACGLRCGQRLARLLLGHLGQTYTHEVQARLIALHGPPGTPSSCSCETCATTRAVRS